MFQKWFTWYVVCVSCACTLVVTGNSTENNTQFNQLIAELGPKRLAQFKGLGDQTLYHWPLVSHNGEYLVQFSGTINQTGSGIAVDCADANVSIVIRHDAIPIPNPRNSLLPDRTFLQSDGILYFGNFHLTKLSQGLKHNIIVVANKSWSGHYFASAFLPIGEKRIDVSGLTKSCHYYGSFKIFISNSSELESSQPHFTAISDNSSMETILTRRQHGLFNVKYMPESLQHNLTTNNSEKVTWDIYPVIDSGGVINIKVKALKPINLEQSSSTLPNITTIGCLQNNFATTANASCQGDFLFLLPGKDTTWYVPFPISGKWSLKLDIQCSSKVNNTIATCASIVQPVEVSISVGFCVEDCQSNKVHGDCGLFREDDVLFTACNCKVGWKGIACNDGSEALSYYTQLVHTLLLTLSNMVFLLCVALAIYRKYFTEALVYFFVCFMSTFYHACDQPGVAVYCLMRYETLQFSDFLSSVTAIWFTLIAVMNVPYRIESWLHVAGCLGIAVGVSLDRFDLWTTVVPAVLGVMGVITCWVLHCCRTHQCYPHKKTILVSIIPGLIFAGTGLVLYAFVETSDNYYIVHSMWHILMACAVLFLLPRERKSKSVTYDFLDRNGTGSSKLSPIALNSAVDIDSDNLSL